MKNNIPKEILYLVHNALASYPVVANTGHAAEIACDAFADALADNPIVPTDEQMASMGHGWEASDIDGEGFFYAVEWQRIMFRAPEPEVPEGVKRLLLDDTHPNAEFSRPTRQFYNAQILEAYRLGQKNGAK